MELDTKAYLDSKLAQCSKDGSTAVPVPVRGSKAWCRFSAEGDIQCTLIPCRRSSSDVGDIVL